MDISSVSVFKDSVGTLLTQLCKLQLQNHQQRAYIVQPQTSRDAKCKHLKKKAYETLFQYLKGRKECSNHSKAGPIKKEIDGVLSYAYHLRCCRKFDEASRLEHLLEKLLSIDGDTEPSEVRSVLLFLVLLAESRSLYNSEIIGHASQKLPLVNSKEKEDIVLPEGPPVYGDSQVCLPESPFYMHYPRELFEATYMKTDIQTEADFKRPSLFELLPGSNLSGEGLFSLKPLLNDTHEREARLTLFGALVEARVTSLDVRLDLPDLPDESEMKCPEIRIPKVISTSQLSDDQGFCSDISSSSMMTASDSAVEEDIWETALSYIPSKHYAWERIGCEPGSTERPYFTEAGPQAVDEWYTLKMREVQLIDPHVVLPEKTEITQSALVKDVINVLLGIQSRTFHFNKSSQQFTIPPGVYVSGVSPDALQLFVEDFMDCGSLYHRLCEFSKPPVMDSFYEMGLVFQAFTGAVRKVLQHYRALILSLPRNLSLMYVKFRCQRIFQQIRYLSQLCWCGGEQRTNDETFPIGIGLLTYLYQETMESINTDNYPMMLSILQTACGPYTVFVQEWVFHGTYRDVYGEFTIQVNSHYLEYRDKLYWTNGYTLAAEEIEDSVPLFLRDMASDIFICGKTINLLKICCPEHFICQVDDLDIPQVSVTFSERELSTLDNRCQMYVSKMYQIARQLTVSREQLVERAEQAKRDLMEKAHTAATQEIARLQAKIDERKKAADMKKRQEFQRLKNQMVTDLQRRANEKEESAELDKEFMARLMKKEEAMDAKEVELEREAREELIKYYGELSEEAARREQKALWKVRRARLELARAEFLAADQERWTKEMQETAEAKAVLDRDVDEIGVTLPPWAKKGIASPDQEPVIADEQEHDESALPKWAERGLAAPPAAVYGLDTSEQTNMPEWAKKGLADYEDNTITVDGGDGDGPVQETAVVSPSKKTSIKLNDSMSANMESEQTPEKKAIRVFEDNTCVKESDPIEETKPQVKLAPDRHATSESVPEEDKKLSVKLSEEMHATKQTESVAEKPHLKTVGDVRVNVESAPGEEMLAPKLKRQAEQHANVETAPKEWKIKQQSFFGHASKLSGLEYDITAPRLKKQEEIYANLQSDTNDFMIRPKIKINKAMTANTESTETKAFRPAIRVDVNKQISKESEYVDTDEVRLKKFKLRNVHGHSSDSTVQKLLYGEKYGSPESKKAKQEEQKETRLAVVQAVSPEAAWLDNETEPYTDNFDFLNDLPNVDLMAMTPIAYGSWGDYGISVERDVDTFQYMPLPALLHKSITASLQAQCRLVNKCIIDYFFSELKIQSHFEALRRFLFMGDGDFAQILSDILLDKLATNPLPQEMLNPIFLNGALTKALQSSMHSDDKYADNLSFALKYSPPVLNQSAHDTLDCLELRYKVDWPLNIILTDSCMSKYSRIFSFMLQLKRTVWVLKDIWHRLKRDSLIHKAGNSPQFRRLQLHRQEMQHFVKVMQGYISNQLILLTWSELLDSLNTSVCNLDDLHQVHAQYLEKAIFRSLQTKKARPVMKIIQDIFSLILKFQTQLVSASWFRDPNTGEVTHPHFSNMMASYQAFREYSVFLFKVVNKLAIRGYQPHLQELLLRLNFNNYYDNS